MTLPPFFYRKAFWEAVTYFVGGLLGLLAFFGVIPAEWAVAPATLLLWVLTALRWFDIEPTARVLYAGHKNEGKE